MNTQPMASIAVGVEALTLTPFAYHSVMVQAGSATLPELVGDRALAFALAAALGRLSARVALPDKDYKTHLGAMPWRTSVLTTSEPRLLPPLVRRLNLDAEAGIKAKVASVAKRGNLKDFYTIQEVPPGVRFQGAVFGFDPFAETGREQLVVRIGLHRNGMLLLRRKEVSSVRLNAATAGLFGCTLPVQRYLLQGLQLTAPMAIDAALAEVSQWWEQ